MLCRKQARTRFNGERDVVVDLDFTAVKTAMDLYEIRDQKEVFEKVRRAFFYFLDQGE